MRVLAFLAMLTGVSASGVEAQASMAPDPELAVAAVIVTSSRPGAKAFDVRPLHVKASSRGRSSDRANTIAKALHADTVAGDKVYVCANSSPRSCSLGSYAHLISMSTPVIAANGKSATIVVSTRSATNLVRMPVEVSDVEYTVERIGENWRVVKQFTTRRS
jgi:hypothetical protein